MTSIITAGSSPDFTPITTASDVATIAVADKKLLASFMVWPEPGFTPMKNTLPMTPSASFIASKSARGPDTITASVPFSAPPTPPLTGLSSCTMLAGLQQVVDLHGHLRADGGEVDEALDALALDDAAGGATSSEACSEGRLTITVSYLVGDVLRRRCGRRAERDELGRRPLSACRTR